MLHARAGRLQGDPALLCQVSGFFPFRSDLAEIEVDRRSCKTDGRRRLQKRSPNGL